MQIQQISIFVENHLGSASEIIEHLSRANINIRALSVADTSDYGIMRLIVDEPDTAKQILTDAGVTVKCTPVLAIPIADQPGGLAETLRILREGNISIEYMYAFVGHKHKNAIVVTKTDSPEGAIRVLQSHGIQPLSQEDLL